MKIKRWFIFLIVACLLATTVSAHGDNIETDGCAVSLPMTRSIDTTFDLDFGQASNWYINFDNEAGLFKFNHKEVTNDGRAQDLHRMTLDCGTRKQSRAILICWLLRAAGAFFMSAGNLIHRRAEVPVS